MSVIKTIIFDFGDVFINLDKEGAMKNALTLFKLNEIPEDLIVINTLYEQGLISSEEFIEFYTDNFPKLSKKDIIDSWNFILKDFPEERLTFLKKLKLENKFKLILLSNTNEIHINWVKEQVRFYNEFKSCFDQFYLSHEINLRKPNDDIYEFVLNQNNLRAEECLFIDDTKDNTEAASKLGIHVWNINEKKEDISNLFTVKKDLF